MIEAPQDWAQLQWHADPASKHFRTRANAQRACNWLNGNRGRHEIWLFRPAVDDCGRIYLERRWIGPWRGLQDL